MNCSRDEHTASGSDEGSSDEWRMTNGNRNEMRYSTSSAQEITRSARENRGQRHILGTNHSSEGWWSAYVCWNYGGVGARAQGTVDR